MGYTQGKNDGLTEGHHKGKSEGLQEGFIKGKAEGFTEGHAQGKRDEHDEAYKNGKKDGLEEGYKKGKKEGTDEGYQEGFRKGRQDVELQREVDGISYKEQIQQMLGPLIQEKSALEGRLRQEKEKFKRLSQEITDKDQLQNSFFLLLGEKHALETKNQKAHEALLQEHTAEKAALLEKIQQLETQQKNVQSDKKAIEDHIEAVQQELEQAQKEINEELFQSVSVSKPESGIGSTEDHGNLADQITTLHKQLKVAKKDQIALGLLQDEYNLLLKDKADLEDNIKKIKLKSAQDENKKITSNVAEIKQLKEEKLKMQNLLDQASDQLMKASSSMALAQVKFAKELEELKENSKSMVELENYTQIQISLIEQQRQVLTLQDAIKEREAVMEQLIKEADKEKQNVIHEMENKIKDMQEKLDFSQDLLLKQRDKFKDMCAINRSRNLTLKELYEENAELMKKFAESDEKRRYFERMERKLKEKCETYKKTMESLHLKLAR
ncbi:unnamed protein product [Lymnaea stagnalis]|uniref:Uncharacterized protein n=1 Tax=Lymnaea stagnalis TaxID=6523 RepID=A0AAV2IDU9_LYMST